MTEPLEQLQDIANLNKYKAAGLIATKTVNEIVKNIKANMKLINLLHIGNSYAKSELDKVYKDIKDKGFCFPICLSLNNIAGYYIPCENDIVKEGDILKIELGIHIDGFPANIVYSTIVNSTSTKIDDKRSNVMKACIEASKQIFPLMTPGHTNKDIVKEMEKCAEKYNCNLPVCNDIGFGPIPGVLSYQMSKYVCDGQNDDDDEFVHRFILSKEHNNYDYSMNVMKLEENEVYAIDILMSTGNGNLQSIEKSTIYKRNHDKKVSLKLKTSRDVLNKFNKNKFPVYLGCEDSRIKLGLKECLEKNLIEKYSVVTDKENEYIARIKFTVIVKDTPILICGKSADDELNKLI